MSNVSIAQQDTVPFFKSSPYYNKTRLKSLVAGEAVLYAGSMVGLYQLWYKNYPQSSFHFFNDNAEWLQMDKIGHMTTSYYIGKLGIDVYKWTGISDKKAILIGGATGFVFETTIEVLDGFSSEWGFSWGDMGANTFGAALVISQGLIWNEQRIQPKFSYSSSKYAQYRPNQLGSNTQESILKDYNGQTYWLSGNISAFMSKQTRFPKWLNIAVGYGADGMTGGYVNPTEVNGKPIPLFTRQRQFYVSLDADLSRIRTKSRFLKSVFTTIGFIKIPAPTLELNAGSGTFKFYPVYF